MGSSKKVSMLVGFVPLPVRIEVAVDKEESGTHTVCIGNSDADVHDPVRVKQFVECPKCQRRHTSTYGFTERGIERDGEVIVLTKEELKAAAGTPRTGNTSKGQPPIKLAFHSREKVYAATVAGDSVQNVFPESGGEKAYALLRQALLDDPDVVACMIWAPSTKNALWTLEVVGERIVATKRCWPEYVRAVPQVPEVPVADVEVAMFNELVATTVEDFDLGRYVDQSKVDLDELVKEREGVPIDIGTGTVSRDDIPDMIAKLQASLAAAGAKPAAKKPARNEFTGRGTKRAPAKKTPAKKAPAKKAVAKKAPAKKVATPRKKVA